MKNKILVYLLLFIILLLAGGILALLRPGVGQGNVSGYNGIEDSLNLQNTQQTPAQNLASLKETELLGGAANSPAAPAYNYNAGVTPVPGVRAPVNAAAGLQAPTAVNPRYSHTTRRPASPGQTRLPGGSASASSAGLGGARSAPNTPGRPVSSGLRGTQNLPETDAYKAANQTLLSYLAPKDRKKQEALMRQMDGFNSLLDNAIARATAPKSKRQAMVEKYTRNSGPQALKNAGGPFAEVLNQISSQKSSVVRSMTDNFGSSFGQQAGKIMDNFQKEAAAVTNRSDLTQQQKGDEIRKINNKYQGQLARLTQLGSLQKMEEEQRQENESYLALLGEKFNQPTQDAARGILDNFTTQKMNLVRQGLPAPEFQEKYLKLKQETDDKVREAVFNANPGRMDTGELLEQVNRQSAREQIARDKEAVEAGLKQDQRVYVSEDVKQKYRENFAAQRAKDQKAIEQAYGAEVAAQFTEIDQAYEKEVLENFDSQEGRLTVNEKNQAAVEKRNKAVQALLEKAQKDPKFKEKQAAQMETEIKKQNEKTISQIMQSDEMRQWPSSAKKDYEQQARTILDDMAKQLSQATVNATDQKAYEQEAQRIQQAAQQRLQNIQVALPQAPAQ